MTRKAYEYSRSSKTRLRIVGKNPHLYPLTNPSVCEVALASRVHLPESYRSGTTRVVNLNRPCHATTCECSPNLALKPSADAQEEVCRSDGLPLCLWKLSFVYGPERWSMGTPREWAVVPLT